MGACDRRNDRGQPLKIGFFMPSFMISWWEQLPGILLLVGGFGFVIFWHELGHFLAAKWAGVRVEQFAVGFGQAILSWRKGIGFRIGSSRQEYERRAREYVETQKGLHAKHNLVEATTDDQKLTY